ncbi:MAG: aminofutalosine synthase MqnE [Armatimonadota bacterium]
MNELGDIRRKVEAGRRISVEDAVRLYASHDLLEVGALANMVRERLNGDRTYYVVNRHINHTNVCVNRCRFCAFSRSPDEPGAYTLHLDQVLERARESAKEGITELHLVGGLHPDLPYSYYRDMIEALHAELPEVHLQAFTAVEIEYFGRLADMSTKETLADLKQVGLGSLPGGGAEVFAPRVRETICPRKLPGEDWLRIHREAHELGLRSNATMLYAHVETDEERADHLRQLRELQDDTGGFMSFIPLAFHPENTGVTPLRARSGFDDLKNVAVARVFLDKFPHVKSFWIMLGLKVAQVSLWFGSDDLDGTVVEERITHEAGATTPQSLTREELERLIRDAGRVPVERNTVYEIVERVTT